MGKVIATIGWGVFCACSWTWCIGMFLPKLMMDRFGWWGFIAFAVPNVIGCTAFGYVLVSGWRSKRIVQRHGFAGLWFSTVAIAYHMFFAAYVATELLPGGDDSALLILMHGGTAMIILLGAALLVSELNDRWWPRLAIGVYALSIAAFVVIARQPNLLSQLAPSEPRQEVLWLLPVLALGFLLCPYLDLTFHRALQRAPSRHAFLVFGATFGVMIVFTCFLWMREQPLAHVAALAHLSAQSVFTVGAHLREIRSRSAAASTEQRAVMLIVPWIAGFVFLLVKSAAGEAAIGETTYLRFLVFYGLLFPAYVLLFIGPWGALKPSPGRLWILAGLAIVLAPFYEAGFIHGRWWMLIVPGIAAAAWLTARAGKAREGRAAG